MRDQRIDSNDFDEDFKERLVASTLEKAVLPRRLFSTMEKESYRPKPLPIRRKKLDVYGNEIEDDVYRNPGGGAGRPSSTHPADKSISIRVTIFQHKKIIVTWGVQVD